MRLLGAILGLVLLAGCATASEQASSTPGNRVPTPEGMVFCEVVNVIDGDTFDVEGCEDAGRVRLILVDAPETYVGGLRCYGREATEFTRRSLEGKQVGLETDTSDTDSGGRLLRYAWIDGALFNEQLVREGFAGWNEWPPDVKRSAQIKAAQDDAQDARRGLWRECGSVGAPLPGAGAPGCEAATADVTALDKRAESVNVTGSGPLGGWYVLSERGNQRYDFPDDFVLDGTVVIWSGVPQFEDDPSRLWWTAEPMWNNGEADPAALYSCEGELVSRLDDAG